MTTTFTMDLPWQVQYLDDDNNIDIPAYNRGKTPMSDPEHFFYSNTCLGHRRNGYRTYGRKPRNKK